MRPFILFWFLVLSLATNGMGVFGQRDPDCCGDLDCSGHCEMNWDDGTCKCGISPYVVVAITLGGFVALVIILFLCHRCYHRIPEANASLTQPIIHQQPAPRVRLQQTAVKHPYYQGQAAYQAEGQQEGDVQQSEGTYNYSRVP